LRKRPSRTAAEHILKINALVDQGWQQPAEIRRKLQDGADAKTLPWPVPSLPTVRALVYKRLPADDSEPWALHDANGDDAAIVLKTLADVIAYTDGRRRSFSRREARYIVTISRACPEPYPLAVWLLAREYMRREASGDDCADLDSALAFGAASMSQSAIKSWDSAVRGGWIKHDFLNDIMVESRGIDDATNK
jgi:hypothetical protein